MRVVHTWHHFVASAILVNGAKAHAAPKRPFSVLVVDDEADTLASFRDVLEGHDAPCHVITAASGKEGLRLLDATAVDLILADYRMPKMNGLDFLARVRDRAPKVPRVLITAYPDLKLAMSALNEGGVVGLFLKPVDAASVIETVERVRAERDAAGKRARTFAAMFEHARRARMVGA